MNNYPIQSVSKKTSQVYVATHHPLVSLIDIEVINPWQVGRISGPALTQAPRQLRVSWNAFPEGRLIRLQSRSIDAYEEWLESLLREILE